MIGATRIRAAADRFVERAGITALPVDVESLVSGLGYRTVREALGDEITGVLIVAPDGPRFCINRQQSAYRQRFVLAHLLGHVQLGHRLPAGEHVHVDTRFEAYRDERKYTAPERQQFEANVFAATVLMPSRMLRAHIDALPRRPLADEDIQALAGAFGVTVQGMMIRLQRARLL